MLTVYRAYQAVFLTLRDAVVTHQVLGSTSHYLPSFRREDAVVVLRFDTLLK